jgi:hypothetical protein
MKPKLSIVATSRNDNHGGDLLPRMQIFLDGLFIQCKKYNVKTELILVEWNPPHDTQRLREVLNWDKNNSLCDVRIIQVPAEIHHRYKYSDGLPLFQMIAKNVGIVRAQGDFILSTNIDIILSDQLMEFLASDKLSKGNVYRVDRHDVSREVFKIEKFKELLNACKDHVIRINHREGITDCQNSETEPSLPPFPTLPFIGKRRKYIPGIQSLDKYRDSRLVMYIYKLIKKHRLWIKLHTNACGDFHLMSKDDWFQLKGAPEMELYSLHIDSLVGYSAYYAGIKEVYLEYPIYHIEHDGGWSPEAEKDRSLYEHYEKVEVPIMTIKEMDAWIHKMHVSKSELHFNDDDWGLSNEQLKEETIN